MYWWFRLYERTHKKLTKIPKSFFLDVCMSRIFSHGQTFLILFGGALAPVKRMFCKRRRRRDETKGTKTIKDLPLPVLANIITFLTANEHCTVQRVCPSFNEAGKFKTSWADTLELSIVQRDVYNQEYKDSLLVQWLLRSEQQLRLSRVTRITLGGKEPLATLGQRLFGRRRIHEDWLWTTDRESVEVVKALGKCMGQRVQQFTLADLKFLQHFDHPLTLTTIVENFPNLERLVTVWNLNNKNNGHSEQQLVRVPSNDTWNAGPIVYRCVDFSMLPRGEEHKQMCPWYLYHSKVGHQTTHYVYQQCCFTPEIIGHFLSLVYHWVRLPPWRLEFKTCVWKTKGVLWSGQQTPIKTEDIQPLIESWIPGKKLHNATIVVS